MGSARDFVYTQWLAGLKENDQKALTAYFDGEEPELEDLTLLVKSEMAPSFKPLTLNRVWKAIQGIATAPEPENKIDSETLKAMQKEIGDLRGALERSMADKAKVYAQLSQLQRMYGAALQEIESLKTKLRVAGATTDAKKDVWIPSKAPPPNMLKGPGEKTSRAARFFRPDRASTHV
mmetsp:Transcript_7135/g.13188  ORF Transcript_7135/g.13188 Transcript_7135/m.13188 type:complete len:178 (-) Transcript_7135:225-758(-)